MSADLLESIVSQHHGGRNDWLYQIDGLRKGRIDIVINVKGQWLYQGDVIERQGLVRLLEDSLLLVDGDYVLRGPEQLLKIKVEDQPFLVTKMELLGDDKPVLRLETASGLSCVVDNDHALELRGLPAQELSTPVVHIRDGLYGRLNRNCYYRLLDLGKLNSEGELEVISSGFLFRLS